MTNLARLTLTILVCSVASLGSGCASTASGVTKGVLDKVFEEEPPEISVRFVATSSMNPDPNGRPSPLVVRFYELKSLGVFDNADFFALYEEDESVLGEDMVAHEEYEFLPGQELEFDRELNMTTRYVGFIAAYRDIESAKWRASVETPADEKTKFTVRLESLSIQLTVHK